MTETRTVQYELAGWLAIISAVLLIPEIGLAVILEFVRSDLKVIIAPIHVANLLIGIYILYMFRKLLNRVFGFHKTDVIITILILIDIVSFIIGIVELGGSMFGLELRADYDLSISMSVLFVYSIVTIVFAATLLKLKDDLFGLLRPYAYMSIASGVCGATVILAPIGVVAAVVALAMQGMIFLRARREAEIL